MTIYCGIDWADKHHDVAIVNDAGTVLATRRIGENAAGATALLMMLAEQAAADTGAEAESVVVDVAIETGRGLLVNAIRAAGHRVFEINPKASSRYRDRHAVSGSKSDPGDALVLAHLLRTDRDRHRPMAADSEQVRALGVLARAQQDAVWSVLRDAGRLRSVLWEQFGVAPDGRLFRGARGGPVADSVYGPVWTAARTKALGIEATPLARRPYDLRHAAVSTWLNGGVPAPQVAAWAGHSVDVLLRVYAKCIAGQEAAARRRVEEALRDGG